MNIKWEIAGSDIKKVTEFVNQVKNPLVEKRLERNINRNNIKIDRDAVIKTMLLSLTAFQQHSVIDKRVISFLSREPFPVKYKADAEENNYDRLLFKLFEEYGLGQYVPRIPNFFLKNLIYLEKTEWSLINELNHILEKEADKNNERILADRIDQMFKGFGSKQARIFLQALGVIKYEIPIDELTLKWLKDFGFHIQFSANALQDRAFYHFISDGIQLLCEKAVIYPCMLEAAIFSSNCKVKWTKENTIF